MHVLSILLLAAPQSMRSNDVVLPIPRFEATAAAEGDAGWSAVTLDGGAGGTAWARARATFELSKEIEAGDWMLCVGAPGLQLSARLNDADLDPVLDACASDPVFAAGPRFDVPSVRLRQGTNRLEIAFEGPRLGLGFERGPAYLLSRTPAARLRASAETGDVELAAANFASLGTATRPAQHLLDRIAFKFADEGGAPRLAGQLDASLVDGESEVPLRQINGRRLNPGFPASHLELVDGRFPKMQTQCLATAPLLTSPLRLSDAKAVTLDFLQAKPRETYEFVWRLRFFPAIGGPLRVVRGESYVLLRNEVVGFFAEGGRVLGSDEAPAGIGVILSTNAATGTRIIAGVRRRCGVVAYEREGVDPSQADSMEDLVETLIEESDEDRDAAEEIGSTIANEPVQGSVVAGVATRRAALATLEAMRRRGARFVHAPAAGVQSAESFWSDTFTLLHFPVHERNTVEWLLSTQEDDGAVRGDLPPEAGELELVAADVYAVLRACRWFRWSYDGDRFVELVPDLARALEHADSVDLLGPPGHAAPGGRERLSSVHLALARAAAHRELVAAVEQIGKFEEIAAASQQAAASQLDALMRPPDRGGRWTEEGFLETPDEDARDAAIALVHGQLSAEQAAVLAKQLARLPSTQPLDWRDVLVLRALLQDGRVTLAGDRFQALHEAVRDAAVPASTAASYHGALCFGLLGMQREDLGTVELRPRLQERQLLRAAIPFREGSVRVQILPPDSQLKRQVIVDNDSSLDLMVVVGIPGGIGPGERVKRGELAHTLYRQVVGQGASWRELLR